jgi:dolichyl-phosphate-mannose--protein O-mannosyl transferase
MSQNHSEFRAALHRSIAGVRRDAFRLVLNPEFFVLLAAGLLTHLWQRFTPNGVLFDELRYEHFSGDYLDGTHYFDVHPPSGKLLCAAEARLSRFLLELCSRDSGFCVSSSNGAESA